MLFSCLEDLIAYLYALCESMRMDMTMQFDLLPTSIRKNEHSGGPEKQPENLLECSLENQSDNLLEGSLKKQPENHFEGSLEKQPENLLEGSLEKEPENLLKGSLEKQPENLHEGSLEKQPENILEAYFHDQILRQQQKVVITKENRTNPEYEEKKKNWKEYNRKYM